MDIKSREEYLVTEVMTAPPQKLQLMLIEAALRFAAKAKERFARMDLNNDGTVSRDERPGWHRGHHGERRGWFGRGGRDHEDRNETPETKPGDSQQPK